MGRASIAGGQSLVPMLNLRLALLVKLVDISRIAELREGCGRMAATSSMGACVRHGEFEDSVVPDAAEQRPDAPGRQPDRLSRDPQQGTIGGSVSLADPSADWVAALIALDAKFNIAGPNGNRTLEARDMFLAPYSTALGDHDIPTSIAVPRPTSGAATGYQKIVRKAGEYPRRYALWSGCRTRAKVVLGAANRVQIILSRSSGLLSEISVWSEQTRASVATAFREDMADIGRTDDPCERSCARRRCCVPCNRHWKPA